MLQLSNNSASASTPLIKISSSMAELHGTPFRLGVLEHPPVPLSCAPGSSIPRRNGTVTPIHFTNRNAVPVRSGPFRALIKSRCWDFGAIENRCYKIGLRLVTFAVLICADIVQKMATEAMVTKFECYRNYIVEYNATDRGFQGESQELGRQIANSHLIGRDRAYGPQRCRVY